MNVNASVQEFKRPKAVELITFNCKDLKCYSVNITKELFKEFDSDEENDPRTSGEKSSFLKVKEKI